MSCNVLIVDDSLSMRSVIRKIITLSRFDVGAFHEAANGREALETLASTWIDVVITDINMPDMNGIELMQAMIKDELYRNIPVVVVTTEANRERIEEAARLGARGFLKKPFLPEELRRVLQSALGLEKHGDYQEKDVMEGEDLDF
ncbi:MAG: response regulator [Pseudomonadota bacterium]|nr:response regulator [Pseudomonadota bacterium]